MPPWHREDENPAGAEAPGASGHEIGTPAGSGPSHASPAPAEHGSAALAEAGSESHAGAGATGLSDGEFDRSTYYEYLAAHTGENRIAGPSPQSGASRTAPTGAGGAGAAGAGAAGAGAPGGGTGGTGGRQGRGRVAGIVIGSIAAVIVIALAIVFGSRFLGPDDGIRSTPIASGQTTSDPTSSASPTTSAEPTLSAEEQLEEIAEEDTQTAMSDLDGAWVVQLSAKQEGLRTEGRTWSQEDILAEFEDNKEAHDDAMLLWSGDWSTFRLGDYWVTILGEPFDDPDDALGVCRDLGLDRDNCFAKKLSTSEGPENSTKLNPEE